MFYFQIKQMYFCLLLIYRVSQEKCARLREGVPYVKVYRYNQNTYVQSWTVTEIMASEVWNFDSCYTLIDYQIHINLLTPNDDYSGRTAPITSKCCILYIYSTNIGTEYFNHGIYSPFFPLQNAVCFINLTYLVPVFFTFNIQGVLEFKKIIPAPKG